MFITTTICDHTVAWGMLPPLLHNCHLIFEFFVQNIVPFSLSAENEEVKNDNQLLAADILRWDNRPAVNKAVRVIAGILSKPTAYIWKELYDELRYKHGIGLSQRGKSPFIQYVKDDEWPCVQQSLSALCEKNGVSPTYVFQRSKLISEGTP